MLRKIMRVAFVVCILAFCALSLVKAGAFPTEINWYEMRYAEKLPPLSAESYLDGEFQTDVEAGLADQILFSTYYKKAYSAAFSQMDKLFTPLRHSIRDRYLNYHGTYIYNGQLINPLIPLEEIDSELDSIAARINEEIAQMPGVEVYLYYVGNDSDINFETGEKTGTYEYFRSILDIPEENCAAFEVDSFEEYHRLFYTGDHHWNHVGAHEGYVQILELVGGKGEALVPVEELDVPGIFNGSKSLLAGTTHYAEHIKAYRYPFPPMEIRSNGEVLPYHGELEKLMEEGGDYCSYTAIYGDDLGCAVFTTGIEGEKIMVVGDSYDNAVLKPLSCHFGELHSVDARYYPYQTGEILDISDYAMANDIDKVLFIGCSSFFVIDMGMGE